MSDNTDHKLLPCPFCGGEALHSTTHHDNDSQEEVQCAGCGASIVHWLPWTADGEEKAAAIASVCDRWNKRAPDPRLEEFHTWERATDRFAELRAENERLRAAMVKARDGLRWSQIHLREADMRSVSVEVGLDAAEAALERKPE